MAGAQGLHGAKGDGAQGIQGIQGEKGDPGDQGIQGIQGEKGDQGDPGQGTREPRRARNPGRARRAGIQGLPGTGATFTRVVGTPSASNDGQSKSATATCPAGVVVGGGFLFLGAQPQNLTVIADYPSDTTTWSVAGEENVIHNGNWSIQAFAICAS